ncbi:MAG: helicase [Phycisphaerales bacterium]|nr:helicase [Phycisphaerales bacterium]
MPAAADLLSSNGPIATAMRAGGLDYESRQQQLAMAEAVSRALEQGSQLLAEAGTGTGKSFAYLVPAILRALLNNQRIVVATNTIALQEQLVARDIPLLRATLDQWGLAPELVARFKPVLVKGRGNYLSIRRMQLAGKREISLFPDAASRDTLKTIEDWAYTTSDGTLSSLPQLERPAVWDRVQSDATNCMGKKCPTYERCFYQKARREMEDGNLLICNHALFFADLAIRAGSNGEAGMLPEYHHVILDEAHNVEDVASEHFGVSLTESRVNHLLSILFHQRTGKGFLANLDLRAEADRSYLESACVGVLKAQDGSHAFFDGLIDLARELRGSGGRVPRPGMAPNTISGPMRELSTRLKLVKEQLKEEQDKYECASYILRAQGIADDAEALIEQSLSGSVYWIESSDADMDPAAGTGGSGGGGSGGSGGTGRRTPRLRMACSPVEVALLLKLHLFNKPLGIIMTSATLATRTLDSRPGDELPERAETAFMHIKSRLGCDAAAILQLDSPFNYARQAEVIVDAGMPSPRGSFAGDAEYIDALADRVVRHVNATDGGAFVLFTSFASLFACADAVGPRLEKLGLPLLVQGRSGSRSHILERFRSEEGAVLFGAASFWQGVDVRGSALRNVIITRLPFDPPDRPLTQARLERIKERGGNPFAEESLPRAVIRFKQGFGRLIRSATDTGRVVVLDPRLMTARYGRAFVDALPPGIEMRVEGEEFGFN